MPCRIFHLLNLFFLMFLLKIYFFMVHSSEAKKVILENTSIESYLMMIHHWLMRKKRAKHGGEKRVEEHRKDRPVGRIQQGLSPFLHPSVNPSKLLSIRLSLCPSTNEELSNEQAERIESIVERREKENPVTSGNRNGKSSYVREEKWEIQ